VKRAALALCLFIVLLVPIVPLSQSGLVLANAEASITKPSIPEFTVKFVDRSYDVPSSSSIDPYTGQNVSHLGYHVENYTIDVTIKNQPFTSYWVMEGTANWTVYFYYNVRFKGHYTEDWMTAYSPENEYPKRSNSTYTVLTYTHSSDDEYVIGGIMTQIHPVAQVDFQVQALIGYVHRVVLTNVTNPTGPWDLAPWIFTGETSDWSNTQTITIDGNAPTTTPTTSPSQYPTATPDAQGDANQQGFNWTEISLFAALGVIVALLVVITLMHRKQTKK
jgi:hypothetical protein